MENWLFPPGKLNLELHRNTSLFQHCVGSVTGKDLPVHRKTPICNWAEPNLMVTSARPLKLKAMQTENFLYARSVTGH